MTHEAEGRAEGVTPTGAAGGSRAAMPLDGAMVIALSAVGGVAVLLALGALFRFGWRAGLGVAVGGLVATVNLWLFALVVRGVLRGGVVGRLWGLLGGLKFVGLLGVAWVLLERGLINGFALAVGYAALPIGIAVGGYLAPRLDDEQTGGARRRELVTRGRPGDGQRRPPS